MSATFDRCLEILFSREGGRANRSLKDDPGGATVYGISQRSHPEAWRDGPPSRDEAAAIFRRDYWDAIRGDDLPWPLCLFVLECAVMSGVPRAVLDLQGACDVRVDGAIGPVTLAAARRLAGDEERLALMLADRALWLAGLRNWQANSRGWLKRLFKDALVGGAAVPARSDPSRAG